MNEHALDSRLTEPVAPAEAVVEDPLATVPLAKPQHFYVATRPEPGCCYLLTTLPSQQVAAVLSAMESHIAAHLLLQLGPRKAEMALSFMDTIKLIDLVVDLAFNTTLTCPAAIRIPESRRDIESHG